MSILVTLTLDCLIVVLFSYIWSQSDDHGVHAQILR